MRPEIRPTLALSTLILAVVLSAASRGPAAAQVGATDPTAAAEDFHRLERARSLYDAGRLEEAEPLLESLVAGRPYDGELWFRLARARHRTGDAAGAREAYRATLRAGYDHEAWIAYQIARLYGQSAAPDSALPWLERSLELRFEDRPGIAGDPAFAELRGDPRFARITGLPAAPPTSRDEGWRRDIDYLVAEAKRMHAAPERPAHSAAFDAAAAALRARVGDLSNDEIVLELGRVVALLGDGHSGIYGPRPDSPLEFDGRWLPLLLHQFADGLYVVDAVGEARRWIGAEVTAFGNVPAGEAVARLERYIHHDNSQTVLWLGVRFLLPGMAYLQAVGATDTPARATLTLRTPDGASRRVTLESGDHARAFRRKLRPPPGADSVPLYLGRVDDRYWLRPLPDHDAVYFQFNQVRDDEEGPSIAAFADSLRRALENTGARSLIVDVRHNNGGNNSLVRPLLRTMVWWEVEDPDHAIWVLTSRNTFSAAQNFINRVERHTDAVFAGEPSSSRPNFSGEETNLTLPYSRVVGSISTRYWQDSDPGDRRPFIAPELSIVPRGVDHFAGRDPVMEAVLRAIADR